MPTTEERLNVVAELVRTLADEHLTERNEWYRWRRVRQFPDGIRPPAIDQNQYEWNVALKMQLNELWASGTYTKRMELATFYVKHWGGIRRLSTDKLDGYVTGNPVVIARSIQGVASWSKVLCIQNPYRYAIFDARVSAALNCLQIANGIQDGILFPLLPSRNARIQAANRVLTGHPFTQNWICADGTRCYEQYLVILNTAAAGCQRLNTKIYTLEMLLFSQAPDLVDRTMMRIAATDPGDSISSLVSIMINLED